MSRRRRDQSMDSQRPDWERLYEEIGERVFRMLVELTGDPTTAEDLTHDTFVRVHERGHQYSGHGSVHGWVFAIARNLAREHFRSTRGRGEPAYHREDDRSERMRPTPEDAVTLEHALDNLPTGQRMALMLHVVHGYAHREIGEMLGIAEGSSKARVSRAKEALREMIEPKLNTERMA